MNQSANNPQGHLEGGAPAPLDTPLDYRQPEGVAEYAKWEQARREQSARLSQPLEGIMPTPEQMEYAIKHRLQPAKLDQSEPIGSGVKQSELDIPMPLDEFRAKARAITEKLLNELKAAEDGGINEDSKQSAAERTANAQDYVNALKAFTGVDLAAPNTSDQSAEVEVTVSPSPREERGAVTYGFEPQTAAELRAKPDIRKMAAQPTLEQELATAEQISTEAIKSSLRGLIQFALDKLFDNEKNGADNFISLTVGELVQLIECWRDLKSDERR